MTLKQETKEKLKFGATGLAGVGAIFADSLLLNLLRNGAMHKNERLEVIAGIVILSFVSFKLLSSAAKQFIFSKSIRD